MGSDLSVLVLAIVLAGAVTLLVEMLRLPITRRTIMIISMSAGGLLAMVFLVSMFFSDKKELGQPLVNAVQPPLSEERMAVMADLRKAIEESKSNTPEKPAAARAADIVAQARTDNAEIPMINKVPEAAVQQETATIVAGPEPAAAVAAKEINLFLDRWQAAWEKSAGAQGDIAAFGSFYDSDYMDNGLDRTAWLAKKAGTNRRKDWIKVELSEIKINNQEKGDIVTVTFLQDYSSSNFTEKTVKTLRLRKTAGAWKILSEG